MLQISWCAHIRSVEKIDPAHSEKGNGRKDPATQTGHTFVAAVAAG
jgi:hypothetical protein